MTERILDRMKKAPELYLIVGVLLTAGAYATAHVCAASPDAGFAVIMLTAVGGFSGAV